MINMKIKNRILIAGLMAIAVTGASTLAYFTSNVTIASNGDSSGALTLDITNGTVKITGKIGDGQDGTPNWSYDVARYSTTDYDKLGTLGNTVAGITTTDKKATDITNYENKHRSPDIILDGTGTTSYSVTSRAPIGTPITGKISKARPGDAFVLGQAVAGGSETNVGLTIKNESTLTTKVDMGLSGSGSTEQTDTFSALTNAGFKLYVGEVGNSGPENVEEVSNVTTLNSKISSILGNALVPNQTAKIYIRLELPLNTADTAQGKLVESGTISNFDLSKLFTIKATQENNPGWTTDGTN